MCDDHAHAAPDVDRSVSRRRLLQGMVSVAALAGCGPEQPARPAASRTSGPAPRTSDRTRLSAYVLAMHLHASASEGVGSMRSHLAEAAANGFDVAWFTEHDTLRRGMFRRSRYHFLPDDRAAGGPWLLPALPPVGALRNDSGGQLVTDPTSPNDPARVKGSLRLRATSSGGPEAAVGHRIDSESGSGANLRGRLFGRTVSVDVLPTVGGADAWGEVRFGLSHHPGSETRPAGVVSVVYRLRADVPQRALSRDAATAIVDVPVLPGQWQTITVDVMADLREAWPDMDPRDNSLHDLEFHAVSRNGALAEYFFGFLRIEEAAIDAVGVEHDLVAAYAEAEPGVLGLVGTEYSGGPHVNQYGGAQLSYDYGPVDRIGEDTGEIRRSLVDFIHRRGGLASINHPMLPVQSWTGTTATAAALSLLGIRAAGADILEVGYGGPGQLAAHLAVWDTLSRNGLFLTGNGVTDDHTGQGWATQEGRFYTSAWAPGLTEAALLDALARGRAYVGYLGSFGGTVDMTLDADVPMGAVSVSERTSRTLRIDVTGLPEGGAVELVRGVVDRAGAGDPIPNTAVVARLGASDLTASSDVAVDTGDDCFVRLQVTDAAGGVVAFGQPVWSLRTPPESGIPRNRRAPA